jgi:hypothetical protein
MNAVFEKTRHASPEIVLFVTTINSCVAYKNELFQNRILPIVFKYTPPKSKQ